MIHKIYINTYIDFKRGHVNACTRIKIKLYTHEVYSCYLNLTKINNKCNILATETLNKKI